MKVGIRVRSQSATPLTLSTSSQATLPHRMSASKSIRLRLRRMFSDPVKYTWSLVKHPGNNKKKYNKNKHNILAIAYKHQDTFSTELVYDIYSKTTQSMYNKVQTKKVVCKQNFSSLNSVALLIQIIAKFVLKTRQISFIFRPHISYLEISRILNQSRSWKSKCANLREKRLVSD